MDRGDLDLFLPVSRGRSPMYRAASTLPLSRQRSNTEHNPFRAAMLDMEMRMQDMQRQIDYMTRQFDNSQMETFPCFFSNEDAFGACRRGELIGLDKSIIKGEDGTKKLQVNVDVRDFKPEEIVLKTKDGFLEVQAQHRDENEHGTSFRHLNRIFKLPKEVKPENLKSELSPDGNLLIEGSIEEAVEAANEPKPIAITHE